MNTTTPDQASPLASDDREETPEAPTRRKKVNYSFVKDIERAPYTVEQITAMNQWRIDSLIIERQWQAITGFYTPEI